MIYIDTRRLNIQGKDIPHGGASYTEQLMQFCKRQNIEYEVINSEHEIKSLSSEHIFISASCYDLLDAGMKCQSYFVIHGLRDSELSENNDYHFFRRLLVSHRTNSIKRRLKLSNVTLVYPSLITKYLFDLTYGVNVADFLIAAAPSDMVGEVIYSSRMPCKRVGKTPDFLMLNADRFVKNFKNVYHAVNLVKSVYKVETNVNYTAAKSLTNNKLFVHRGFLSKEELYSLMHSSILIFPSLSEGYGLPLKDHQGVKIISGSATMTWEHSSVNSIFVNPRSTKEIAAAIMLATEYQPEKFSFTEPNKVFESIFSHSN